MGLALFIDHMEAMNFRTHPKFFSFILNSIFIAQPPRRSTHSHLFESTTIALVVATMSRSASGSPIGLGSLVPKRALSISSDDLPLVSTHQYQIASEIKASQIPCVRQVSNPILASSTGRMNSTMSLGKRQCDALRRRRTLSWVLSKDAMQKGMSIPDDIA